jgi:flagellar protein FlbD
MKENVRHWTFYDDISQGSIALGVVMIMLTKINKVPIALNSDLIQYIEETPDTVITMTNNDKVVVLEGMLEIIQKVIHFRRFINRQIEAEYERQRGTI